MHEYITAVPAYVSDEAGTAYRGLMPLIGADMADYRANITGLTLVKGHFVSWREMHLNNFGSEPLSNLEPTQGYRDPKGELYERWMQWLSDALIEVREGFPEATIDDLERVVRWGGAMPFMITDTTCRTCAKVGQAVVVIAPMCWPITPQPGDDRRPWESAFPAEHLRVEVATSHDYSYETIIAQTNAHWAQMLEMGWTPYYEEEEGDLSYKEWTLSDLYENGYDDLVEQIEEEAAEMVMEVCAERHADIAHIPDRVLREWVRVVQLQISAYITRNNSASRQISFAVAEGLHIWRGVTGR